MCFCSHAARPPSPSCSPPPQVRQAADQPLQLHEQRALEQVFVFAAVWAIGSCLSEKDGEDMRKRFSDHWKATCKNVRFPSRDTVFDYYLHPETGKLEPWKSSPFFYSIEYNSTTPMSQVTVPTPETCSVTFWLQVHPSLLFPCAALTVSSSSPCSASSSALSTRGSQPCWWATLAAARHSS